MTREEIRDNILSLDSNCILAELPTSVGKTRVALEFIKEKKLSGNILIVIPRKVLIDNWKEEFVKWGYEPYLKQVTFTTYISFPKYASEKYSLIVFDECHHMSERVRDAVESFNSDYYLLLSATVSRAMKKELKLLFPEIKCYRVSVREAIDNDILPDPKVYLIPMVLNTKDITETIIIHPNAKKDGGVIPFSQRFAARKNSKVKYTIHCTQDEYHKDLCGMIDMLKRKYMSSNNEIIFYRWQRLCKDRLLWLAGLKEKKAKNLLGELKGSRTLTFCSGIKQTQELGKYCINSKNDESAQYLKKFNEGKISHITACDMLNEGVNLVNCQIGIFVYINSSDTIKIQKLGRILRHQEPIIYIMYFKGTREKQIVDEMIGTYNQELVTVIN